MKETTFSVKANNRDGFTLVEVMIAICIIGIGLMAVAKLQAAALNADKLAREQTEAAMWASNQAEDLINKAFDDAELATGTDFVGTPRGENNKYNISWTVTNPNGDANVKHILISVSWDAHRAQKTMNFDYVKSNI